MCFLICAPVPEVGNVQPILQKPLLPPGVTNRPGDQCLTSILDKLCPVWSASKEQTQQVLKDKLWLLKITTYPDYESLSTLYI